MAIIQGTYNDDILNGTSSDDEIYGNGGDDTISGSGGNDKLVGGAGADTLTGGTGIDAFKYDTREFGTDTITDFQVGVDKIDVSGLNVGDFATLQRFIADDVNGNAVITLSYRGFTEKIILTGVSAATLSASSFNFNTSVTNLTVDGSYDDDVLFGGNANDTLTGGGGEDTLTGGVGADTLVGGSGNDTLIGGVGSDAFKYDTREFGTDTITDFQVGVDKIDVSGLNIGDFATLQRFIADDANGDAVITLSYRGFTEKIILTGVSAATLSASSFNFNTSVTNLTVNGSYDDDVLFGGNANDTLNGGGGEDTLSGGAGADTLVGDSGNDTLIGGVGADAFKYDTREFGTDTITDFQVGVDKIDVSGLNIGDLTSVQRFISNDINGNAVITLSYRGFTEKIVLTGVSAAALTASSFKYNVGTADLTVNGSYDDDVLFGGNANDTLTGGGGEDTLTGGTGADTLVGGSGNDTLIGGVGADAFKYDTREFGTDTITDFQVGVDKIDVSGLNIGDFTSVQRFISNDINGNAVITLGYRGFTEKIVLTGVSAAALTASSFKYNVGTADLTVNGSYDDDVLFGGNTNDTLTGGGGDDTLTGGLGADTLLGGTGNDVYYVDNVSDVVTENASEGTDRVYSTVTYTLANNVESLVLTGAGNSNGTGNSLNNTLIGNSANNTLNGGGGADIMQGGLGDDTYHIDNAADVVIESSGGGTDKVLSSVSYAAGSQFVEQIWLTGSANINATGNGLNNILIGNTGNNTLNGGAGVDNLQGGLGNDIYFVDNTSDVVIEASGAGTDKIFSSVSYSVATTFVEQLWLTGSANINATGNGLNNVIIGNSGNNVLNGGAGADNLQGGLGNDSYFVDSASDVILEAGGAGIDTIYSSVTYSAPVNIENLVLTGTANINATGNSLANLIKGNTGNNILDGQAGNDTLVGVGGADTAMYQLLTGADARGGNGSDSWTDFTVGNTAVNSNADKIDIGDLLIGYGGGGTLAALDPYLTVNISGSNTTVLIDRDGAGGTYTDTLLLTLNGVNTNLLTLINNNQILI